MCLQKIFFCAQTVALCSAMGHKLNSIGYYYVVYLWRGNWFCKRAVFVTSVWWTKPFFWVNATCEYVKSRGAS